LQNFWLKVGRKIFFRLYQSLGVLNPYDCFSSYPRDIFARAKRDFSYYSRYVDFSGKRVLDVGCGTGIKSIYYSKASMEVIGLDASKTFIKKAHDFIQNHRLNSVNFLVADGAHLPFTGNSFDIVTSNDALEHIYDCRGTVSEMERVVEIGGYVCINFGPLWHSPFGSHSYLKEFFSPPWAHLFFPEESIKDTLIKLGRIPKGERCEPLFEHLNRITIREFEEILNSTKLRILFFRLYTGSPFEPLVKTPFREFLVTQVITLLKKVSDVPK